MSSTQTKPAPRRRLSPEARQAQLLDAAMEVFARMGLERAGHGDIAKLAGVSTPTVFNYFPTRDALVAAVLERIDMRVSDMFERIPARADDRRHRILQLSGAFRKMVEQHPSETKTFLKWGVSFDPALRPAWLAFQNRMLDRLIEVLPNNPEDPTQARAEARILLGTSSLFAAMTFDDYQPDEMIGFVGRIADVLS